MLSDSEIVLIKELCKQNIDENYNMIKELLLDHIKKEPLDIDVRLKLIKHTYSTQPGEIDEVLLYINDLLMHDQQNIYALLYMAYIQRYDIGEMDYRLIEKLMSSLGNDKEINAMISLAISWYYELKKQYTEQESWLKKSIHYSSTIVRNYYELILFYFEQNKLQQAKALIPFAVNNIQHVFDPANYMDDLYLQDSTDVEEFFNVRYKQIHVWKFFKDDLLSMQNI
jgi:hypothetical protein